MLLKNTSTEYNNQKGQAALFITLIVMFILLLVGLSVSRVAFEQTKIARSAQQSAQAYYLADTGTEHILYEMKNGGVSTCPPIPPPPVLLIPKAPPPDTESFAGGSYEVNHTGCNPNPEIKISGVFEKTNRAIEISY